MPLYKKSPDEKFMVLITWKCDSKCPGCVYEKLLGRLHMPMKTFGRVKSGIGHFHEVAVAGGEPTLHPKFWEIIEKIAARKPSSFQIITNGLSFSRAQREAREFMARLNQIAAKAKIGIALRVSVDDFHCAGLKGGAKELKRRVQNMLKVASQGENLGVSFFAQRAPKQSTKALLAKYGLPESNTYVGVWKKDNPGVTLHNTIFTPEGHVYARQADLVEGKMPLGNITKDSHRTIRGRRR